VEVLGAYLGDERVRVVYRPKSVSRGEETRHEVLLGSRSTFVAYLGDDDLMLTDHLEQMIDLLADADFAHPLPVSVERDGRLFWYATDLSRAECREWHQRPGRNGVSLSGVVHRLSAYRRLPVGWRPAPPGSWSDHYMWQQWFATLGLRYRTGTRPTILKFDAAWRTDFSDEERRAELLDWRQRSTSPDFADELARLATDALRDFGIRAQLELAQARDELAETSSVAARVPELDRAIAELHGDVHSLHAEIDQLRGQLEHARTERDEARRERDLIAATRTWRAHDWATGLRPMQALLRMRRTGVGVSKQA
ncbi:MAG: hypothetical protein QOE97_2128, partial [Pseudonocardiales bacterium]|nr:hypothetical protein [Pseudonocardiales bacterium]